MSRWTLPTAALAALFTTACALRLGGPEPVEMVITAALAPDGADATALAARLRDADSRVALVSAPRDTAWFAAVAAAAGMELSGPGPAGTTSLAFLSRGVELLGDTTVTVGLPSGGQLFLHDALYRMEDERLLDLMLARMLPGVGAQEGVRAILNYIAVDVSDDAGILLALDAPSAAVADSAATMVLAYLENARECMDSQAGESGRLRLFYGPGARIRCVAASVDPNATATTVTARVVVGR